MTIPVWVLLAFAGWTLLTLTSTVGLYRWGHILTGRASLSEWNPDLPQGSDWYRRAMRAHMNCVENLPVYGAIVVALVASGTTGPSLDVLAIVLIVARVCQTLLHIGTRPGEFTAGLRFTFFFVQLICMLAMGGIVVARAL
ncbi:MAG TPA: MAPEG family protein [Woeseiaceae bacterium]|nr:MAPEG family protein [Woeseiaceae bacterium]